MHRYTLAALLLYFTAFFGLCRDIFYSLEPKDGEYGLDVLAEVVLRSSEQLMSQMARGGCMRYEIIVEMSGKSCRILNTVLCLDVTASVTMYYYINVKVFKKTVAQPARR